MIIKPYNRTLAVDYANRWALLRNPEYYDYNEIGGDCTNFASQCVYSGSGVMNYTDTFGWYYINANDKSPSWTGVEYFYNFMIGNEGIGPFAEELPLNQLLPGDVIQLRNESGVFYHTLVLTDIINFRRRRLYLVNSHSLDSYRRNLFSYRFSGFRGIHILGVRTENDD